MSKKSILKRVFAGFMAVTMLSGCSLVSASEAYTNEMMAAFENEVEDFFYNESANALLGKLETNLRNREAITQDIYIKLDESNNWELIRENLGAQVEMKTTYAQEFFESGELSEAIKEDLVNKVAPMPMFRWGGTSSNYVDFTANLGPLADRKTSVTDDLTYVPAKEDPFEPYGVMEMGTGELLQMQLINNPDSSLIPCISWYRMPPEKCKQLAQFFFDDPSESKWGKMRVEQYGIEEPVKVHYWELSNEVDYYASLDTSKMDKYIEWARASIEAIRSVDPEARFIICGPSAPWGTSKDWRVWPEYVFNGLCDLVDGTSFHPYYDGYPPEMMIGYLEELYKMMNTTGAEHGITDAEGNPKEYIVVCTEGARFSVPGEVPPGCASFEGGLCNIHFINIIMQKQYIKGHALHSLTGGTVWPYWIIQSGRILSTPTEKMYHAYIDNLGDRIIASDWSPVPAEGEDYYWWNENYKYTLTKYPSGADFVNTPSTKFSVNAMGDGKNEVVLVVTNKSMDTAYTLNLMSDYKYELIEETLIEAPNPFIWVYNEITEALTTVTVNKKSGSLDGYKLPPFTMAVLRLKTSSSLPALGESAASGSEDAVVDVELGEDSFRDIEGYWAKNEIELMRQQGFINGNGTGLYNPHAPVTRGEFYTILARIMNTTGKYKGSAFADVNANDWFADGANTAYRESIIKDSMFNAASGMDFFEICTAVRRIYSNHGVEVHTGTADPAQSFDITDWTVVQTDTVKFAMDNGILTRLYESGELTANRLVTKGEAAAILYRISSKIGG